MDFTKHGNLSLHNSSIGKKNFYDPV